MLDDEYDLYSNELRRRKHSNIDDCEYLHYSPYPEVDDVNLKCTL